MKSEEEIKDINFNKLCKLKEIYEDSLNEANKFYEMGNKAAGTRLRKNMQEIKNIAQEIRTNVQDIKNSI